MKVIFVSNVTPLQSNATSTDIMTYNIIYGLSKVCDELIMVAINSNRTEKDKNLIRECYGDIAKEIYIFNSKLGKNKGKYSYLMKLYKNLIFSSYKKEAKSLTNVIDENTIIVSHSPSVESVSFCKFLKKINNEIKWIQYWSDPIALSGINPEEFSIKRYPYFWLEKECIKLGDKVVYGTKTLYEFQKLMFKKQVKKMSHVDVSYSATYDEKNYTTKNSNDLLYAGNYYKYTRNIMPLYEAIEKLSGEYKLNVFGKGDQYKESKYITYNERISPKELNNIEKNHKNIICLMNSKCIQIPGKTFYDIASDKNILVIIDGIHKKEIKKYLESYHRFIIVNNEPLSIIEGIKRLNSLHCDINEIKKKYSPEKIAKDILK